MIPSSNLYKQAIRLIGRTKINYYKFTGRTINEIGYDVSTYVGPQELLASVQAVPRNVYQIYGLDFQKKYWMVYIDENLLDIERDVSGDQIIFQNRQIQCMSATDWFGIDGWKSLLCVDTGPAQDFINGIFGYIQNDQSGKIWGFNSDAATFDNGNFGS